MCVVCVIVWVCVQVHVCGVCVCVYVHGVCAVCMVWYEYMCGVCGLCVCMHTCRVTGCDGRINGSVNNPNSPFGIICFKLFSQRWCLQKQHNTRQPKQLLNSTHSPCHFTYRNHSPTHLPILAPCKVTSRVFGTFWNPWLARGHSQSVA